MTDHLLEVDGLQAGYGQSRVLDGITFSMGTESVAIIGRNGMGKTTLCKALMGLIRPSAGLVRFDGVELNGLTPEKISKAGIGYVPQGRRLFPSLTVDEHLRMLANGTKGKTMDVQRLSTSCFLGSLRDARTAEASCPGESSKCSPWAGHSC